MNQRNFFREILFQERKATKALDRDTLTALASVKSFIQGGRGVWTTYRRLDEFVAVCFKPVATISKSMGLTEISTRDLISQLSNSLYDSLGRDFFELIEGRNFTEAYNRMDVLMFEDALDVVLSDLWRESGKRVNGQESKLGLVHYDPESMGNEIGLLTQFSNFALREQMEGVSQTRVAFLLGILDGTYGTPAERADLINRIREGVSL